MSETLGRENDVVVTRSSVEPIVCAVRLAGKLAFLVTIGMQRRDSVCEAGGCR